MAQLELRNATLRLIDGYANTALVNDTPLNGDAQLDIDNLGTAGLIPVGTRFTLQDSGALYKHYVTDEDHNQITQIVVAGASSGNFTITAGGQTTANIVFDANAATVQSALEALSNIAPGDVLVTSPTTSTWLIEFKATYAGVAVVVTADNVDLDAGTVTPSTVNAHTSTNRIYFTPALVTAQDLPEDNDTITFAGRTLEVKIGEGNCTYNEQRTMEYVLDRGELDNVREGDDVPMDVSLDFVWEFLSSISGADTPTIEEVFKNEGNASSWESSDSDTCRPFAVDLEIEHIPPCGGEEPEIVTLPDFRWESLNHDLRAATVAVSGKCNAKEAIVARVA